jgi:alanine racemase
MFDPSCIELSKSALLHNIAFLRKQVGPKVILSAVVKGNAYGHGIEAFASLLEECGLRHFSVFCASEALQARQYLSPESELMIMGHVDNQALEWCIANDISFYVFELQRLKAALAISRRLRQPARVHLEVETGLNRTGLEGEPFARALRLIKENQEQLQIAGICTHYAGAESVANYKRIQEQIVLFKKRCAELKASGLNPGLRHTASSAAALIYPETRMDLVRVGIALYGFWPSKETETRFLINDGGLDQRHYVDPLIRVMRWRSSVMSLKRIEPGEFVGYGNAYLATRQMRIASVPVGYCHGFSRALSNLGRVLIRGKRVAIVGNVNMSMLLVNVSEVKGVKLGDEVVMIGKQKKAQMSVSSFSDLSNLLNYEALARLPADIPRILVD